MSSSSIANGSIRISSPKSSSSRGKCNELLVGIVVSRWDNIVGPQCTYLWTEELTSLFYPGNLPKHITRLVKYVTDHTVDHSSEVDGNSHSVMKTALCLVPDLNLAYSTIFIRIPAEPLSYELDEPCITIPHSISILAHLDYLEHFILMRPLILNWLSEFGPKIGVLLCKNHLHSSMINSWCAEFCKTITAIRTCWCQEILSDKTNSLATSNKKRDDFKEKTKNRIVNNNRANFNWETSRMSYKNPKISSLILPSFHLLNQNTLEILLTSHLSTGGSSIVIGSDSSAINQVIRFLLCFVRIDEGYCSRYVLPTLPDTFMKGLFVQGLIMGEIGEKSISMNQLNSNRLPFTRVQLISSKLGKVKQMPIMSHRETREITLFNELISLWDISSIYSLVPASEIFTVAEHISKVAKCVTKFLGEIKELKPERRYGRLLLFKRNLHAKAISLITYLQSIKFKPHKERQLLSKRICRTLGFDESEYLIAQMNAEKIRPGVQVLFKNNYN